MKHRRVAIDFDGTLFEDCRSIDDSFENKAPLTPKPHAKEVTAWFKEQNIEILIFTCRPDYHRQYLESLLTKNGISFDYILFYTKPRVDLYIDDKGFRFENWEDTQKWVADQLNLPHLQMTPSDAPRILVLGAGGNAGLNVIKSFKKANPNTFIIGTDIDSYNLDIIPADRTLLLPFGNDSKKREILLNIIEEENIDYIHAQPDLEVQFLLENKDAFGPYTFPHNLDIWKQFRNKLHCQLTWDKTLGLNFKSLPLQSVIDDPTQFDTLKSSGQKKVWFRAISGAGSRASLPVYTVDQAINWAQYWIETKNYKIEDFMLCEFLPSNEYAVQTFWINEELIHSQARKRLVYFFGSVMPSGQSSTPAVAETIHDRNVYDTAYNAIKAIDPTPHGVYCIDMKENIHGKIIPMEVNYGRLFTTSDFFTALGMNTPHAMMDYVLNQHISKSIETVKEPYRWYRGIDREPFLNKVSLS